MRDDCCSTALNASNADSMHTIGERYSKEICDGDVLAYSVDDASHDGFYLARCKGLPKQAEDDITITIDRDNYELRKGDWYCRAIWFEKLYGARNWWTMPDRNCIVKLETVIDVNVTILQESPANPLPRGLPRSSWKIAKEDGSWRLSDHSHAFFAEESRLRACLEYDVELVKVGEGGER